MMNFTEAFKWEAYDDTLNDIYKNRNLTILSLGVQWIRHKEDNVIRK